MASTTVSPSRNEVPRLPLPWVYIDGLDAPEQAAPPHYDLQLSCSYGLYSYGPPRYDLQLSWLATLAHVHSHNNNCYLLAKNRRVCGDRGLDDG